MHAGHNTTELARSRSVTAQAYKHTHTPKHANSCLARWWTERLDVLMLIATRRYRRRDHANTRERQRETVYTIGDRHHEHTRARAPGLSGMKTRVWWPRSVLSWQNAAIEISPWGCLQLCIGCTIIYAPATGSIAGLVAGGDLHADQRRRPRWWWWWWWCARKKVSRSRGLAALLFAVHDASIFKQHSPHTRKNCHCWDEHTRRPKKKKHQRAINNCGACVCVVEFIDNNGMLL